MANYLWIVDHPPRIVTSAYKEYSVYNCARMALTSGTKLGPYEIQSPLGSGGMGEVYRATDTKLGRDVALKVLPAEMAHDPERLARFRREAKALAQLDHPNIVTIYSVEESEGVHLLTMQLIEGQPLDHLITSAGLSLDQIVEIATALADALAAAHEKGIVHRDLKPANVMVSNEGRVKVLDFGLAKDIRAANLGDATMTSDSCTQIGVVMGTPAYMSPEQTSGHPLDHRTDIFSLGVVLHEMATGRRPFEGTSSAELVSAILRDTPPSVTEARPDLPSDLARIVRRCLEKDPRHRLQTARDVSNEFRDLSRSSSRAAPVPTAASRVPAAPASGSARADEGFWVAVLPFKYAGTSAELKALADGLSDDIVTGLSRFSYLRVIARSSTARYANESTDVRAAGKDLGARYVMEGSLRQAGSKVRIAVQLIDTTSGAGLWAETYDRAFTLESTLDLLDDVVPRIVATVGDTQGVLPHSMTAALRNRDPESLTPYEAVLRSFGYHQHVNAAEHLVAVTALEKAAKQEPDRADCWAALSWLYRAEFTPGFNSRPDPLDRALAAARRAIELAPSNQLAHASLACALFFRRDLSAFRPAARRALALNRMEGYITAYVGQLIAYSGDWEAGCELAERATQLNPNHPGWYWLPMVWNAYRQHDGQRALEFAVKINMPGLWTAQLTLATVYSQLGEMALARNAVQDLLAIRPNFPAQVQQELAKLWQPELASQMLADLRKAGLEIPEKETRPASAPALTTGGSRITSADARADEGFWVALLPFKYTGASAELKSLADGLSEEIVTGLSRFSYLRVIARGSTAKYSTESSDVRAIGKELGARYIVEGSLRHAGTKMRLAMQLVESTTGAHLWAETYERTFSPETVFELQDDLVPRIVSTVADMNGVLPRSMSEAVRSRTPEQLSPYEAVLRSFGYLERVTPEDLAAGRSGLELAVQKAPAYADAWAMLAFLCVQEYGQGFNLQADSLASGLTAARRAVEAGPSNPLAFCSLAQALFFHKEFQSFRNAAERAVALNPMDGNSIAFLGELLTYAGNCERGLALAGRAKQLNPNHPGWYWYADFYNAYRQGDYRDALSFALKSNLPNHWGAHTAMAAVCGQLGERDTARKALRDLLKLRPDFAASARKDFEKWWAPEYVEQLMDGLRKAGLEIAGEPSSSPAKAAADAARNPGSVTPSIAVLPFANMSADKDQEYFSDGLAEEIINLLTQIPGLKVIARTSAFAFRGKEQDIRRIADALGVTHVLEGSVRRSGNRLRITGQLIHAADRTHLWSERYDRELSDIFAVQDEISAAIAKALRVKLSGEAVPQRYVPKLPAYEAYLKAKYLLAKVTPESLELARRCYEQANELDPAFGLARVGLGHYWVGMTIFARHPVHEAVRAARAEAQRALQIDPSLPDAHALLGYLAAIYDLDWAEAERHFDFPMAKQVGTTITRPLYAWFQFSRGKAEQAIELARRAIDEDPLEVWPRMNLHAYLQGASREGEALEQLKKVLELDENQAVALVSMAMIRADQGDLSEALVIARRANSIGPWLPETTGVLAGLLRRNGEEAESRSVAQSLGSGEAVGDARNNAIFHLLCGELDEGADWAEKAIKERDLSMMIYLRFAVCKGLRASHRWPKIANMLNLPV